MPQRFEPSAFVARQRIERMRARRHQIVGLTLLASAAACGRFVEDPGSGPQAGPTSSPSPSPSYLQDDDRWAPPTHREDGRTVMPVTFPDGSRAEVVYPPELALQDLSVYPDTFADGGPRACGASVSATRYDPHGEGAWFIGDEPLWEHERPDGLMVQQWRGTSDHGGSFLVYRFGSWTVLVPCLDSAEPEDLRLWAESLHGDETPEGLLVLESTPPLVVNPWRDHPPVIRFSDRQVIFELSPDSAQCDQSSAGGGDTTAGDGVVQYCIQPQGGVYLYANGFSSEGRRFLEALVEDLEVRRVRPPD
jgi:hypothetical protein